MDKLIHMSLNSLDIALRKQAINAQNLSNANVNGYRRDIYESFGSVYLNARNQIESRAFSTTFEILLLENCNIEIALEAGSFLII